MTTGIRNINNCSCTCLYLSYNQKYLTWRMPGLHWNAARINTCTKFTSIPIWHTFLSHPLHESKKKWIIYAPFLACAVADEWLRFTNEQQQQQQPHTRIKRRRNNMVPPKDQRYRNRMHYIPYMRCARMHCVAYAITKMGTKREWIKSHMPKMHLNIILFKKRNMDSAMLVVRQKGMVGRWLHERGGCMLFCVGNVRDANIITAEIFLRDFFISSLLFVWFWFFSKQNIYSNILH